MKRTVSTLFASKTSTVNRRSTMKRPRNNSTSPVFLVITITLWFSSFLSHVSIVHGNNITQHTPGRLAIKIKPIIYTYFERIPSNIRTTGMSDEDDAQLLYFWNQTWHEAGWTPVILTKEDAERHADFRNIQEETFAADSFAKVLVNRWLAMAAVGGGWYADYDVFPLREFSSENQAMKQMTVHDICSPTLASGSADEWLLTLQTLLEEARERYSTSSFWTDCLGITRLISNNHQHRPKTEKRVAMPYDRNDPVISNNSADCSARNFRSRWVVHFGPTMLQTAKSVPPSKRHPKYRLALAKDWLSRWNEICSEVVLESK